MAILRASFVALLLVCAVNASQPLESARDQYKAHEDMPHPPQLLSEATDQAVDVHQLYGIDSPVKTERTNKLKVNHKFHVGSEKRQEELEPQESVQKQKPEDVRQRRHIDITLRNSLATHYYNPWSPPLSSFSIWQPQIYQISRPYYIPVWGSPGRVPLYFPPQPLYINTGHPIDNPPKEYLPPNREYLPADPRPTTPAEDATTVTTMPKFGEGPVFDEKPVWGSVPNSVAGSSTVVVPTRRPRPPGQRPATHPPLVHNAQSGNSAAEIGNQLGVATTTASPNGFSTVQRPPAALAPPARQPDLPSGKQPSRCVWAVISCCSTSSTNVSYSCFEQLGCTGAFWDTSPCNSEFARAAIANVMNYYNSN